MFHVRLSALLLCIIVLQIPHVSLAASCRLAKVADLHVTVTPRNQILIDGSMKGEPTQFQIDTLNVANIAPIKADTRQLHGIHDDHEKDTDMMLGVDFIKNHHIYLAPRDRKMYFTYNGGGIFSPPKEDPAATTASK